MSEAVRSSGACQPESGITLSLPGIYTPEFLFGRQHGRVPPLIHARKMRMPQRNRRESITLSRRGCEARDNCGYEAVAYCRFNSARNRSKYESKVTNPLVPWKKARPRVARAMRLSEL